MEAIFQHTLHFQSIFQLQEKASELERSLLSLQKRLKEEGEQEEAEKTNEILAANYEQIRKELRKLTWTILVRIFYDFIPSVSQDQFVFNEFNSFIEIALRMGPDSLNFNFGLI